MSAFIQRFKEPSSWAGIGVLLSVVGPLVGIPPGGAEILVNAGSAVAAALAFFLKEKNI